MKRNYTHCE